MADRTAEFTAAHGTRFRLTNDVERYPHFIADKGMTGTISEVNDHLIALRMDEALEGAEDWNNEVHWFEADTFEDLVRDFLADAEPMTAERLADAVLEYLESAAREGIEVLTNCDLAEPFVEGTNPGNEAEIEQREAELSSALELLKSRQRIVEFAHELAGHVNYKLVGGAND